jgi:hypothetical protein
MHFFRAVIFFTAVLLTGCGSIRQPVYQEPSPQGNAAIEFSHSGLYLFQLFGNPTDCSELTLLPPAADFLRGGTRPLIVQAGKEVGFMGFARPDGGITGGAVRRCEVAVSFTPQAGVKYKARFVDGSDSCGWSVSRVDTSSGREVLTPEPSLKMKKLHTDNVVSGSLCKSER